MDTSSSRRMWLWLEKLSHTPGHPSFCWVSSGHWPFANYRYYPVSCEVKSGLAVGQHRRLQRVFGFLSRDYGKLRKQRQRQG